ncbi:predicted protein [Streptomyces viridochromogenes DSM 40736]|uniref:Predicted protein n=1 Tax=Streptomyces viridochromogenes (strain DSM 40736 / JCM 4977 / BCRC 1201 / Tue 494) TaxID=591159 RepID=D9XHS4_STRVT|nr:predicted protein [Streptomyces viridochromogenes DSM 40736]
MRALPGRPSRGPRRLGHRTGTAAVPGLTLPGGRCRQGRSHAPTHRSFPSPLPPGRLKDDGKPRGLDFIALGARAIDNVEFLQSEWVGSGNFIVFRLADGNSPVDLPLPHASTAGPWTHSVHGNLPELASAISDAHAATDLGPGGAQEVKSERPPPSVP